jgi:hypothetical protein
MKRSWIALAALALVLQPASLVRAQLSSYSQNFEGMIPAENVIPNTLSNDGWLVGANVFQPDGTTFLYNYFAFPAPNGGSAFSGVVTGEGGPDQGNNQLSVYNDYNNAGSHDAGHRIEAIVFRDMGNISAADVGKTYQFSFDVKQGNIGGAPASTATAFIKVLNPSAGFSQVAIDSANTTAVGANWAGDVLSLTVQPGWEGNLIQIGFTNTASNYQPAGVFYDNVNFSAQATAPSLVSARPYHDSFPGPDGPAKVDTSVSMILRGPAVQSATLSNVISSTQGINGVVLDFDQLNALGDISLEYKMSPPNVFADPITSWPDAPPPASTELLADAGDAGSDRVLIKWTSGSIANRYLCIKVIYAGSTIAELYLGHLRGEMTGDSGGKFTVLVGDILAVRTDLTQAKTASGRTDVDKSGTVLVQDILDTRSNLAKELTQLSVPALP